MTKLILTAREAAAVVAFLNERSVTIQTQIGELDSLLWTLKDYTVRKPFVAQRDALVDSLRDVLNEVSALTEGDCSGEIERAVDDILDRNDTIQALRSESVQNALFGPASDAESFGRGLPVYDTDALAAAGARLDANGVWRWPDHWLDEDHDAIDRARGLPLYTEEHEASDEDAAIDAEWERRSELAFYGDGCRD